MSADEFENFVSSWLYPSGPSGDEIDAKVRAAAETLSEDEARRFGIAADATVAAQLTAIRTRAERNSEFARANALFARGDVEGARQLWERVAASGHPVYSARAEANLAAAPPREAAQPLGAITLRMLLQNLDVAAARAPSGPQVFGADSATSASREEALWLEVDWRLARRMFRRSRCRVPLLGRRRGFCRNAFLDGRRWFRAEDFLDDFVDALRPKILAVVFRRRVVLALWLLVLLLLVAGTGFVALLHRSEPCAALVCDVATLGGHPLAVFLVVVAVLVVFSLLALWTRGLTRVTRGQFVALAAAAAVGVLAVSGVVAVLAALAAALATTLVGPPTLLAIVGAAAMWLKRRWQAHQSRRQ